MSLDKSSLFVSCHGIVRAGNSEVNLVVTNQEVVVTVVTCFSKCSALNCNKNRVLSQKFSVSKFVSIFNEICKVDRLYCLNCCVNNLERGGCDLSNTVCTSLTGYNNCHTDFKTFHSSVIYLVCIVTTISVLEVNTVILVTICFALNSCYNTGYCNESILFSCHKFSKSIGVKCRNLKVEKHVCCRTVGSSDECSKCVCDVFFASFRSFRNVNCSCVFSCIYIVLVNRNIVLNLYVNVVCSPFNCISTVLERKNLCQVVVINCVGNRHFFCCHERGIKLDYSAFSIIQVIGGCLLTPGEGELTSCECRYGKNQDEYKT